MPRNWQGQPQCGEIIIRASPPSPGQAAWRGTVTDPRDGSIYDATLRLDSLNRLHLHGYIGLPLFGQTQIWQPYAGPRLTDCQMPGQTSG